jgi:hypothetical protein
MLLALADISSLSWDPHRARVVPMVSPDAGRGSGFGNPEQKAELQRGRQAEEADYLRRDRRAKESIRAQRAHDGARAPWWKRFFRRS